MHGGLPGIVRGRRTLRNAEDERGDGAKNRRSSRRKGWWCPPSACTRRSEERRRSAPHRRATTADPQAAIETAPRDRWSMAGLLARGRPAAASVGRPSVAPRSGRTMRHGAGTALSIDTCVMRDNGAARTVLQARERTGVSQAGCCLSAR